MADNCEDGCGNGIHPEYGACAQNTINALPNNEWTVAAGCKKIWYKIGCNNKNTFDPKAANAVLSELQNAIKSANLTYDCCRLDNLARALGCSTLDIADLSETDEVFVEICTPDGRLKASVADILTAICLDNVPDSSGICGEKKQLVLVNDGTCNKLAYFLESSSRIGLFSFYQVATHLPINQGVFILPDDFAQPTIYAWSEVVADDNFGAGVIDEAKLVNQIVSRAEFYNTCDRSLNFELTLNTVQPSLVQEAYDQKSIISYRHRINGGAWVYPRTPINSGLLAFSPFNAIDSTYEIDIMLFLTQGDVEVEFIWYPLNLVNDYVSLLANTYEPSQSVPVPRLIVKETL